MTYERDRLASFNERLKRSATFLDAIGLGLIGFAVLRPATELPFSLSGASVAWGVVGLAMHVAALYLMRYLRKERGDGLV